jgi:small conductance mechanosensitive channel
MQEYIDKILPLITSYGVKVIGVIVVLIVAWIIAGWLSGAIRRGMSRARIDETLTKFTSKMTRWLILVLAVLSCLAGFGVPVMGFAAVIGASALAVGLAFQGSLSNFAAGVMLLVFRPFKVGDVVSVAGQTGKIDEIGLFTTIMDTADNRRLILPNGSVFGAVIENISYHATRRLDVAVGCEYPADLDRTREVLLGAARSLPTVLPEPEPAVVLLELGDSSINWSVRVWVNASDYWPTRDALTRAVKVALDEAGIGIPFPQMDVHLDAPVAVAGTPGA